MILEFGAKDKNNNCFLRNHYCHIDNGFLEQKCAFIKKHSNIDIYQTIYRYQTQDVKTLDICPIIAPLYFDLDIELDTEEAYKKIKNEAVFIIHSLESLGIKKEEIQIYFSGSKGFHLLVSENVLNIIPMVNLNDIYHEWAKIFVKAGNLECVDLKIYDRRRLFRVANTINSKTGLYKIPISYSFLLESTLKKIKQSATHSCFFIPKIYKTNLKAALNFLTASQGILIKKYKKHKTYSNINSIGSIKKKKIIPPCIYQILSTNVDKGSRNSLTNILSNVLYQEGYKDNEVFNIVEEWNKKNNPPLSDTELKTTIKSSKSSYEKQMNYGCSSIQTLGFCIEQKCPIYKG